MLVELEIRHGIHVGKALDKPLAGVVGKEEGFWIGLPEKKRTANSTAKLVQPKRWFACGVEIVLGIKSGVAKNSKTSP